MGKWLARREVAGDENSVAVVGRFTFTVYLIRIRLASRIKPAAASPVILKMFINTMLILNKVLTADAFVVDDASDGLCKHLSH